MFALSESFIAAIREGNEDFALELASSEQFSVREAYMDTQLDPALADIHVWIVANLMKCEEDEMPLAPSTKPKREITEEELETPSLRNILIEALHARR